MKLTTTVVFVLLLAINSVLFGQDLISETDSVNRDSTALTVENISVPSAFKQGKLTGLIRYFFMATDNGKGLTDYYANAFGGGLRYETGTYRGLQFAASFYSVFNVGSSDLTQPDLLTGQFSRYEIALFDLEDPDKKKDINKLEEAYLKYNFKQSKIVLGRQLINTPFINMQDGRMRPTAVQGLWIEWNEFKDWKIEAGWINAISPRGTTGWHNAGNSIGLFPLGLNVNGKKSQYFQDVETKGIAIAGVTKKIHNLNFQVWNVFVEHVFNTALVQADLSFPLPNNESVSIATQFIKQNVVKNGGNDIPEKRYFENSSAMSFGASLRWKTKLWETSINYNRITKHGRYLMPREWGSDPFFTFMTRERNEGLGDVHAFMAKIHYQIPHSSIKTTLSGGYYKLPDHNYFILNKYIMPSYKQLNLDAKYSFGGAFEGLNLQLLVLGKFSNAQDLPPQARFNKVDMFQYNFILNYYF